MRGKRLRKAQILAERRFKIWYPDFDPNANIYRLFREDKNKGALRKTNVACSCQECRNPRHSMHYNNIEKLTIQERRAPTVNEELEADREGQPYELARSDRI